MYDMSAFEYISMCSTQHPAGKEQLNHLTIYWIVDQNMEKLKEIFVKMFLFRNVWRREHRSNEETTQGENCDLLGNILCVWSNVFVVVA